MNNDKYGNEPKLAFYTGQMNKMLVKNGTTGSKNVMLAQRKRWCPEHPILIIELGLTKAYDLTTLLTMSGIMVTC